VRRHSPSNGRSLLQATAREAALLQAASWALARRSQEIGRAADRLAVVTGGSVLAATGALAKAQDYALPPLEERLHHMHRWASSSSGQRLLRRSKLHLKLRTAAAYSARRRVPLPILRLLLALSILALASAALVYLSPPTVVLGLGLVLGSLTAVAAFLPWWLLAEGPEDSDVWHEGNHEAWKAKDAFLLASCFYLAGSAVAWFRCAGTKPAGGRTTV
ncbi:unnamed protein product, partial [Polarella glacialis]